MTIDFEPLRCPMCGGELRYSEGTHDLCCVENRPELLNLETVRLLGEGENRPRARVLHEPRAEYGGDEVTGGPENDTAGDEKKQENERMCVFAVSFTESGTHGTLWSIRTVHGRTNYFSLMRLMDKIEKRQRRGERLAANVPNPPRKVERSKECQLAFRYRIEVEDLYSIKYSSETAERLAVYYGLTEPDIRQIQAANIGEE